MREVVLIIWGILIMIGGMVLMWSLKKTNRKIGKYVMYHNLVLMILSFGVSLLLHWLMPDTNHLIWSIRIGVLAIAGLNLWVIYKQKWSLQDKFDYDKDGFLPEMLFVFLGGLICAIAFATAPQVLGLIPYRVDVSLFMWDLPFVFMLPFLVLKLLDAGTQIPWRSIENPWIYPIEPVNAENWPWRDLMQVNFQVKQSLREEYYIFSWPAFPWIEAPKEVGLGNVFRLTMQERRKRSELTSIQDMGIEYDGDPQFCWMFSVKKIWYRPSTWFRKPRFVNPDLSIKANKIQEGDIIIARRIPGNGSKPMHIEYNSNSDFDSEKTVIIKR